MLIHKLLKSVKTERLAKIFSKIQTLSFGPIFCLVRLENILIILRNDKQLDISPILFKKCSQLLSKLK